MTEYIRARAPLRIGIAGGGTDVDPYASTYGGCVFNSTINKYAYCTLVPRDDDIMKVKSRYFGRYKTRLNHGPLKFDGNMDLAKAVANHFEIERGFTLDIHSDVPSGSGLGGSSTMIVAIIAAISEWIGKKMDKYEMADLAYKLEREDIGLKGGKQDQYASVFGGFNLIDFGKEVKVNPVEIDQRIIDELQCRSVMCFTGMSRESAKVIDSQITAYKNHQNIDALDQSKILAKELCEAVVKGKLDVAGELLDQSWQYKKQFSSSVSNRNINSLYNIAKSQGAIGGKVSGAGGGGFMFFICEYDKKAIVAQELKKHGAEVTDFMFEPNGVKTWRFENE
ncbi:MAG: kinase [Candidatus Methanomethylophilaceae archaeon]|nr:kinase [Candidatus Methanomethylophilaceae archaeon]